MKIGQTVQAILDACVLYLDSSLADLYDETTVPPKLHKAHKQNDKAVMRAYGFDIKTTTETHLCGEADKDASRDGAGKRRELNCKKMRMTQ